MTEQATLNENVSENDLKTCEILLTVGKITIDGHGLKRGFLKKWIVRVRISKVIAMRSKIVPGQFCYFLSIMVEFMQ